MGGTDIDKGRTLDVCLTGTAIHTATNNYLGISPLSSQHQPNDGQHTNAVPHARTYIIFICPHLHLTIDINK